MDNLREEVLKEVVNTAFAIITIAALAIVQRAMRDPDFTRTQKMKGALYVQRFAMKQQRFWQEVSDSADEFYRGQTLEG